MSKLSKYLETLSADEVTQKLGDWCETYKHNLVDKKKGVLRTLFNAARMTPKGMTIARIAAQKNGVDHKQGHDNVLADVAKAVQARGSQSAAKIQDYVDYVEKCRAATPEYAGKNPFKAVRAAVKNGKNLG